MRIEDFFNQLAIDKSVADKLNFNPYYVEIGSGLSGRVKINGDDFINLAANNYLGLAGDQRVKEAMIQAVHEYGASMCGTPIATGYTSGFSRLETVLAAFTGLEAAIVFPSGYQANMALFAAIASKEDLILVDHYAHASLIHGIRNVGCKIKPFLHNRVDHLQKMLKTAQGFRQIFVVSESVFSTEGSIAPFDDMVNVCKMYDAIPVIDDSHGIGVIGPGGKGILEARGIENYKGIYTASLGKGLANAGGVIAGNARLIDYLKYACSGLIYSTALPPANVAGLLKVLEIINTEFDEISTKMWDHKKQIETVLQDNHFELCLGEAPIISVKSGSLENTVRMTRKFFREKILTTPFVEPSVPPNEGRIRLIAGADLQEEEINYVCEAVGRLAKK